MTCDIYNLSNDMSTNSIWKLCVVISSKLNFNLLYPLTQVLFNFALEYAIRRFRQTRRA
jgi:hypothetical protein